MAETTVIESASDARSSVVTGVTGRVIAWAAAVAATLALSVAAQTYLSMLGHGHAFFRILLWQLSIWTFWAVVAPFVLQRGIALAAGQPTTNDYLKMVGVGLLLVMAHNAVAAQLTIWIQPFVPVQRYDFSTAFVSQLPALFAGDCLTFGLLAITGGTAQVQRRAQQLEVRESRLEAALARAELHALRLEVEPHFLFNTLNSISALVRLNESGPALDMLAKLGEFMRGNLDRPATQFSPLSSELWWVKQYAGLQEARFGDRLRVAYDVGDDCEHIPVPALLLLPVVENAFRHGLGTQSRAGHLAICAKRLAGRLALTVSDDGAGLPAGFDEHVQNGTGLRNIRSRLSQLYGSRASFEIRPAAGGGTIVSIMVPIESAS